MRSNRRDVTRVVLQDHLGNVLHKIGHAEGSGMVNMKTAVAIRDYRYGRNEVVGYRLTEQVPASKSANSSPEITPREMALNVLNSSTAYLPEWDTQARDSKHARELARDPRQPVEDFVELAQNKIKYWPRVPLWNPKHIAWAGQT